jgi:hypothetical protein
MMKHVTEKGLTLTRETKFLFTGECVANVVDDLLVLCNELSTKIQQCVRDYTFIVTIEAENLWLAEYYLERRHLTIYK